MKIKSHKWVRTALNLITILVIHAACPFVICGQETSPTKNSGVPQIAGTWRAKISHSNGSEEYRWEIAQPRVQPSGYVGWRMTVTLLSTTDPNRRQYIGQSPQNGFFDLGPSSNWRFGQGEGFKQTHFQSSENCQLSSTKIYCEGTQSVFHESRPRLSVTIEASREGAAPPAPDIKTEEKRLPIIFLPGVAGTSLMRTVSDQTQQAARPREGITATADFSLLSGGAIELWPFSNGRREYLQLKEDGETERLPNSNIRVGSVLSARPTNFYGGIRDYLASKGYPNTGSDRRYVEFPYDWRLDNASHLLALDRLVNQTLEETGASKVVLLAHSMGGVIARAYILSSPEKAAKIDKLITMGTPYWGAAKPYYGAISGYTFGNFTARQELMKVLIQNWPAAYQLMPNYEFIFEPYQKRMLSLDESATIRYKWFHSGSPGLISDTYIRSPSNEKSLNPGLLKRAQEFKQVFGSRHQPTPLPGGIKHYVIIGTGVKTLELFWIEYASFDSLLLRVLGEWRSIGSEFQEVRLHPRFNDGDGTVALVGSEISTATSTYYIPYVERWGPDISSAHGDLPSNSTVLQIVGEILDGKPPDPNNYKYEYAKGLKDLEPGADFTLRSDAYLNITDAATGRQLGFNSDGGIVEDLPSGSFIAMEGVEYASIADVNRPLNVAVNGIRDGKFTLEVNIVRPDGQMKKFAYREVAVKKGTVAKVGFTPGQALALPDLAVTTNGDIQMVKAIELPPDRPVIPRRIPPETGSSMVADGTFLGTIPSVGAKVKSFRFFTTNADEPPPVGTRSYQSRFISADLRVIYYEIVFEYLTDGASTFNMTAIWNRKGDGSPFAQHNLSMSKPPDLNVGTKTYGHAYRAVNQWKKGSYTVQIHVGGSKIAEGTFVVE